MASNINANVPASSANLESSPIRSNFLAAKNEIETIQSALPSGNVVGTTDSQTLSSKTIQGTKESVFQISDSSSVDLNPANGGIQTWTLEANRTPSADNFSSGQSMLLMINDGSARLITWTTVGVVWVGGAAPSLALTGYTCVELWKVDSTIYGAHVGDVL